MSAYHAKLGRKPLAGILEATWRDNEERLAGNWPVEAQRSQKDTVRMRPDPRQRQGAAPMHGTFPAGPRGGDYTSGAPAILPVRDSRGNSEDAQRPTRRGDSGFLLQDGGWLNDRGGREAEEPAGGQPGLAIAQSDIQTPASIDRIARNPVEPSDRILIDLANAFGVTVDGLKRHAVGWSDYGLSCVRHGAYKLIRDKLGYSYARIGRIMGERHHTTIMSGIQKAEKLIRENPEYRAAYERARQG